MNKALIFLICILVVFSAGFIGSIANMNTTSSQWYEENRPDITPPGFVFPIVWNILYLLIAISLYLCWTKAKEYQKRNMALIFGANLILNALWSILFFGLRAPIIAFVGIIVLWLTIIGMIIVTKRINTTAAWLLVPYFLWVSFASILNLLFFL